MSVVALCSAKASPGVTTTAAALATIHAHNRRGPVVLIEADSGGGSLGPRHQLAPSPSLATFAADSRHGFEAAVFDRNLQAVNTGSSADNQLDCLEVLVSPPDPDLLARSLMAAAGQLAEGLGERTDGEVVIDLGRLDQMAPSMPLALAADRVVMLVRPAVAEVAVAVHRARRLLDVGCHLSLVCVGERPHHPDEVAAALGLELLGVVADSPRAAGALRLGDRPEGRLRRSLWWRSMGALAAAMVAESDLGAVAS